MTVDSKPVRASKRSAKWLREAVDVCYRQKVGRVRLSEQGEMVRAYDHARQTYDRLIAESPGRITRSPDILQMRVSEWVVAAFFAWTTILALSLSIPGQMRVRTLFGKSGRFCWPI